MRARIPRRGGRPPKFDEPRRPVTLTLPVRALEQLEAIHPDRAIAIVRLLETASPAPAAATPRVEVVEVVEVAPGIAVILVAPSRRLRSLPFLHLVEIGPDRHLLALPSGTAVEALEVAIGDLIDRLEPEEARERAILEELLARLKDLRRSRSVSKAEILFVHTERGRPVPPRLSRRPAGASASGRDVRRRSAGRRAARRDP